MFGCQPPEETIPPITPSSGTTESEEQEHDHGEEGHEHGEGTESGEDHAEGHDEGEHAETEGASEGEEATTETEESDSAATTSGEEIRFVANKSINVPGMMCPYSCWPNVKDTLASLPGVEGVQLAEQPEGTQEGEIKKRVVELKVTDVFDPDSAVAALNKINFESDVIN